MEAETETTETEKETGEDKKENKKKQGAVDSESGAVLGQEQDQDQDQGQGQSVGAGVGTGQESVFDNNLRIIQDSDYSDYSDYSDDSCSKHSKAPILTLAVLDLQGFGMAQMSQKCMDQIKLFVSVDNVCYPETLGKMLIINAPWLVNSGTYIRHRMKNYSSLA